jgi:hypothetical protein
MAIQLPHLAYIAVLPFILNTRFKKSYFLEIPDYNVGGLYQTRMDRRPFNCSVVFSHEPFFELFFSGPRGSFLNGRSILA